MSRQCTLLSIVLALVIWPAMSGGHAGDGLDYTAEFGLGYGETLTPHGGNAYFSLEPGTIHHYAGHEDGAFVEVTSEVLPEVRVLRTKLHGRRVRLNARVIEERVHVDGRLAEIDHGYYAMCSESRNVYMLGEDSYGVEDDRSFELEHSWCVGFDGARFGLAMPGHFLIGSRYYSTHVPGVTIDQVEHVDMGFEIDTPAGRFDDCVSIVETSVLEDDEIVLKRYVAGVGLLSDGALQLVEWAPASP